MRNNHFFSYIFAYWLNCGLWKINKTNIAPNKEGNFKSHTSLYHDIPYDLSSIMQYDSTVGHSRSQFSCFYIIKIFSGQGCVSRNNFRRNKKTNVNWKIIIIQFYWTFRTITSAIIFKSSFYIRNPALYIIEKLWRINNYVITVSRLISLTK